LSRTTLRVSGVIQEENLFQAKTLAGFASYLRTVSQFKLVVSSLVGVVSGSSEENRAGPLPEVSRRSRNRNS
jgi:hypothetical protein